MQEEVENRTLTLVVNGTKFTGRGSDGRAGDGLPCIGAGRNRAEAYGRQRGGGDCGFAVK